MDQAPILNRKVCGLCLSTMKYGIDLIRRGEVDNGLQHLHQLSVHITQWHRAIDKKEEAENGLLRSTEDSD